MAQSPRLVARLAAGWRSARLGRDPIKWDHIPDELRADMRIAGAALIFSMALWSGVGLAQNAPPAQRVGHPAATVAKSPPAAPGSKPVASDTKIDPKKKAAPAARDSAVISQGERALIQFDLAWAGAYNGLITGETNDKTT